MDFALHAYVSLQSRFQIRLLILEPAINHDDPIWISFCAANLTELEGTYEALSYTWGEPVRSFPLLFYDGTVVFVTENLDIALRRLRYSSHPRRLWVDAVCINQDDASEKSIQIPRMVNIFRGAKRVIAHLGSGERGEEEAIHIFSQLTRSSSADIERSARALSDGNSGVPSTLPAEHLRSVVCFLSLPWFSRMWIIQEVVFNLDVILICGNADISWPRLRLALSIYARCIGPPGSLSSRIEAIDKIFRLWKKYNFIDLGLDVYDSLDGSGASPSSQPKAGITDLMAEFSSYRCSDDRDRIFALYSMATDLIPSTLPPVPGSIIVDVDYSLDLHETYRHFAMALMVRHDGRHIAELLRQAASRRSQPASPSWVPDWRQPVVFAPLASQMDEDNLVFDTMVDNKFYLSMRGCLGQRKVGPNLDFFEVSEIGPSYDPSGGVECDTRFLLAIGDEFLNRLSVYLQSSYIYPNLRSRVPQRSFPLTSLEDRPDFQKGFSGRCMFFISDYLKNQVCFMGIGSTEIMVEDKVLICTSIPEEDFKKGFHGFPALILRQATVAAYCLVGDAEIFPIGDLSSFASAESGQYTVHRHGFRQKLDMNSWLEEEMENRGWVVDWAYFGLV